MLTPSVRRSALQRLVSGNKLNEAIARSDPRATNQGQQLLEFILQGKAIQIEKLSRKALLTVSMICGWIDGIVPVTQYRQNADKALPLADLFAPMKKLADESFVGREAELKELANYVGMYEDGNWFTSSARSIYRLITDLYSNPPLLIHGPGGLGKSSLLAKFILAHGVNESGKRALPFAYLDVDRSVIDIERPSTFILEASRQLALQLPELQSSLQKLCHYIKSTLSGYDRNRQSHSFSREASVADEFGSIISKAKYPVAVVVDTFEEAQYMGTDLVAGIWQMFVNIQKAAPNVRTIVAGRSVVSEFPVRLLSLNELSQTDARALLSKKFKGSRLKPEELKKIIAEIIDMVGRNPFSLRLASEVVKDEGIEKLRTVETKTWLVLKVRSEIIQARLYGRILAHIHDPTIQKLAYPGLIVRRITPAIIFHVLAEPCQIEVKDIEWANTIFHSLAQEASLVHVDRDGSLRHRQDVRKIMLQDLKNAVDVQVVRAIHDNAIDFYQNFSDSVSRAEEIYHRLCLDQATALLEPRWIDGAGLEVYLRNAVEEIPTSAKIWLSRKLQITPDKELIKKADLESWEESTFISVQRYLTSGLNEEALELLRSRTDRSPGSKLFTVELETLRMLGRFEEALKQLDTFIPLALTSSKPDIIRELFIQAGLINEAMSELPKALDHAQEVEKMLGNQPADFEALKIYVIILRILRKMGAKFDRQRSDLLEKTIRCLKNQETLHQLRESPSLLRELAAEAGHISPDVLTNAIDWIGIDLITDEDVDELSKALEKWDTSLKEISGEQISQLARRTGVTTTASNRWKTFVLNNAGRSLTDIIQNARKELKGKETENVLVNEFDRVVVGIFRRNVDATIEIGSKKIRHAKFDFR